MSRLDLESGVVVRDVPSQADSSTDSNTKLVLRYSSTQNTVLGYSVLEYSIRVLTVLEYSVAVL